MSDFDYLYYTTKNISALTQENDFRRIEDSKKQDSKLIKRSEDLFSKNSRKIDGVINYNHEFLTDTEKRELEALDAFRQKRILHINANENKNNLAARYKQDQWLNRGAIILGAIAGGVIGFKKPKELVESVNKVIKPLQLIAKVDAKKKLTKLGIALGGALGGLAGTTIVILNNSLDAIGYHANKFMGSQKD